MYRLVVIVGRRARPPTTQVDWGPFGAQMAVKWPIYESTIRGYTGTKHVPFDQGGVHVGDAHLCHGICPLKQQAYEDSNRLRIKLMD